MEVEVVGVVVVEELVSVVVVVVVGEVVVVVVPDVVFVDVVDVVLVAATEPEVVVLDETVNFAIVGLLITGFGATLTSVFLAITFLTATFAGVFIVGLVATFTVVFGASKLISAADAVEGATRAKRAITAAIDIFFIVSFSSQELFLAI